VAGFAPERRYGGVIVASADETAARLTIKPIADIANMRSMAALLQYQRNISTGPLNRK
jgi:hypothetical protein